MLALAYDAALRREELGSLRTGDLDPEITKNRLERVVPYSASAGRCCRVTSPSGL